MMLVNDSWWLTFRLWMRSNPPSISSVKQAWGSLRWKKHIYASESERLPGCSLCLPKQWTSGFSLNGHPKNWWFAPCHGTLGISLVFQKTAPHNVTTIPFVISQVFFKWYLKTSNVAVYFFSSTGWAVLKPSKIHQLYPFLQVLSTCRIIQWFQGPLEPR